jgi:hypothetical protein
MKLKFLLFILPAFVVGSCIAQTKAKAKTKKKKVVKTQSYFTLLEAYNQRIVPGTPEGPEETGQHFVIKWQTATYPETFFWRGDAGWMNCKIEKARKVTGNRRNMPKGIDYTTKMVTGDDITNGDTLMLTPVRGGRFPIPPEIPESAKNTLFFKTGGSKWLSYPVKNIGTKPDIMMP